VIRRDDEEDRLKRQTCNELRSLMQSDASTIQRALDMILISRNLERIADHATNIAEDVIFMVLGQDIRHGVVPVDDVGDETRAAAPKSGS